MIMKGKRDLVRDPSADSNRALAEVVRRTPTRILCFGVLVGVAFTVGIWPSVSDGRIHLPHLLPAVALLLITGAHFTYCHRAGVEAARRLTVAMPEETTVESQHQRGA